MARSVEQPDNIRTALESVPATVERPIYTDWKHIEQAGIARAQVAPTEQSPSGVPPNGFNRRMNRTVLQQHCDYFDLNGDGIITPLETYIALRLLNWSIFYCLFATVFIHSGLSYITLPPGHWLPDPLFRIHLDYVGSAKHGSDSGAYDNEGRFRPQLFADVFTKFGQKLDNGDYGITFKQAMKGAWGQRCVADVFGITARVAEWSASYLTIWPADGIMRMEDVRGIYDGSYFYKVAGKRREQYVPMTSKKHL